LALSIISLERYKKVLGSSPNEDGFCRLETKYNGRTALRPKLFWQAVYRNKGHRPENISWVLVPLQMISLAWKLSK
jgi:hypothetical protein